MYPTLKTPRVSLALNGYSILDISNLIFLFKTEPYRFAVSMVHGAGQMAMTRPIPYSFVVSNSIGCRDCELRQQDVTIEHLSTQEANFT